MDIKLKYKAWVGEKHADIASPLTNSDIEVYATEFAEWLVKNLDIQRVSNAKRPFCPKCRDNSYTVTSALTFNYHCLRCDNVWAK